MLLSVIFLGYLPAASVQFTLEKKVRKVSECLIYILGSTPSPHPVTVTTRNITFLVGNQIKSYKPLFANVTGWGVVPINIYIYIYVINKIYT